VQHLSFTLIAIIAVALFFDFTNGFHDAANSIATSVSTRAVSPRLAVLAAGVLNFIGAFISFKVAATIAKGIVEQGAVTLEVILAGLIGAITWNLLTWFFGLPSSSSHALIGGVVGSSVAATGFHVIKWSGLYEKVAKPSLLAPLLAIPGAALLTFLIFAVVRRRSPRRVNTVFRRFQLISAGFVALTHGTNDAQKTMGILALALVTSGNLSPDFTRPPDWVIVSAASAMAFGTYAGGWRIIGTLGQRIAKIEPPQGFAAETATAAILWYTAHAGFPVSTTHTVSSAILGAGATGSRLSAVRWGVAGNIVIAWLITLPCSGVVGAGVERLTRVPGGVALSVVLTCVLAGLAFAGRTRRPSFAFGAR
jgi:PiT family inorganic phosphate transporter